MGFQIGGISIFYSKKWLKIDPLKVFMEYNIPHINLDPPELNLSQICMRSARYHPLRAKGGGGDTARFARKGGGAHGIILQIFTECVLIF